MERRANTNTKNKTKTPSFCMSTPTKKPAKGKCQPKGVCYEYTNEYIYYCIWSSDSEGMIKKMIIH